MPNMHGPAFDGSGKIIERDVPEADIQAYKAAGYKLGPLPATEPKKPAETLAEKIEKEAPAKAAKPARGRRR